MSAAPPPPRLSPDGRFYWDGQRWVLVPPSAAVVGPSNPGVATSQFSSDGKWWWDGQRWVSAVSPDGRYRWNGAAWSPVRKMLFGDYANQSIFCAVVGLLCGFLFPFGVWAGYRAYKELPQKQAQAIVGMVLNSVGCVLVVLGIILRVTLASH